MIFRLIQFQVVEHRNHHCRSGVFGTQSVAATNNKRFISPIVEDIADIEVKWIACCPWFFGAVEDTNTFYRFRKNIKEIFR